MKRFLSGGSNRGDQNKKPDPLADDTKEEGAFLETTGCLMIFGKMAAYDSKHRQKLMRYEVYVTEPATPAFLRWSRSPITFDRSDHSESVPHSGRYQLVVDSIISTKWLTKALMDGGSELNIMYAETLDAMGIDRMHVQSTRVPFHSIMPGK
jgi:hypothetical protein